MEIEFYGASFSWNGKVYWLRRATRQDVPRLRVMVNSAYGALAELGLNYTGTYQGEATTLERLSKATAFLLGTGEDWIGTISVQLKTEQQGEDLGSKILYLSQLAVDPAWKSLGWGSRLLDFGEHLARAVGANALELDTALPAKHLISLYEAKGYGKTREVRWEGKNYSSGIFRKELEVSNLDCASEVGNEWWSAVTKNLVQIVPLSAAHLGCMTALCGDLGYPAEPDAVALRIQEFLGTKHSIPRKILVLESSQKEALGFAELQLMSPLHTEKFLEVVSLVVGSAHRNHGFGKMLIEGCMCIAESWGLNKIQLRSNRRRKDAHEFYKTLGFAEESASLKFGLSMSPFLPKD